MKKIVLVAILMLAAPALAADCNFVVVPDEDKTGKVAIYYDSRGSTLPRAFALDITCDSNAHIVAIRNYKQGMSVAGSEGYGIFPGSIYIDESGDINDVGTPVADPCQLPSDTQPGLGIAPGITIEMGSLYKGAPNAPDPCGLLCRLQVSSDCNLTLAANVGRGQVVLEGATQATTNLPIVVNVPIDCLPPDLFPLPVPLPVTQEMIDRWVYLGKPLCWCCEAQKYGNGAYGGASASRVDTADLAALKLSWFLTYTDPNYNPCVNVNIDGRVDTTDLARMKTYWFQNVGSCPEVW